MAGVVVVGSEEHVVDDAVIAAAAARRVQTQGRMTSSVSGCRIWG